MPLTYMILKFLGVVFTLYLHYIINQNLIFGPNHASIQATLTCIVVIIALIPSLIAFVMSAMLNLKSQNFLPNLLWCHLLPRLLLLRIGNNLLQVMSILPIQVGLLILPPYPFILLFLLPTLIQPLPLLHHYLLLPNSHLPSPHPHLTIPKTNNHLNEPTCFQLSTMTIH